MYSISLATEIEQLVQSYSNTNELVSERLLNWFTFESYI